MVVKKFEQPENWFENKKALRRVTEGLFAACFGILCTVTSHPKCSCSLLGGASRTTTATTCGETDRAKIHKAEKLEKRLKMKLKKKTPFGAVSEGRLYAE